MGTVQFATVVMAAQLLFAFRALAQSSPKSRIERSEIGRAIAPRIGPASFVGPPDIRVHESPNWQSEVSIAINPADVNDLLIGANTRMGTETVGQGYYYASDGGNIWSGSDALPGITHTSHPAVQFDADGNAYFNYLDEVGHWRLRIAKSTNQGQAWLPAVEVPNAGDPDKNHMAIDVSSGLHRNNIYIGYTDISASWAIKFSRSIDGGATFSSSVDISTPATSLFSQAANVAVGPNGQVYVVWAIYDDWAPGVFGEDAIGFNKSPDGGDSWSNGGRRLFDIEGTGFLWTPKNPPNQAVRVPGWPSLAVDRSGGIWNGRLYLVWSDRRHGDPDVLLSKSSDGGTTWDTTPLRVNDDPVGNGRDQFFPWVSVSPYGLVCVVFYDSRDDPNNHLTETWLALSSDGGQTFTNFQVSDVGFTPYPIVPSTGYWGDYIGIATKVGTAYPAWMDNRVDWVDDYQVFVDPTDTYNDDLLALARSSRSVSPTATAWGSTMKSVYTTGSSKWHRLFQTDDQLCYSSSTDDGLTWQFPEEPFINGSVSVSSNSNPALATRADSLYSVFSSSAEGAYYRIYLNRATSGGVWLADPLSLYSSSAELTHLSFAIGPAGVGHVVWVEKTASNSLKHGLFDPNAATPVLTAVTTVFSSTAGITNPALAVDSNGSPHVTWSMSNEIGYRYKSGASWSPLDNISRNSGVSRAPSILGSGTTIYTVWHDNTPGNYEIYYRERAGNGTWTPPLNQPPQNISTSADPSAYPFIGGLISGAPVVLWTERVGGNDEIKYSWVGQGDTGFFATTPGSSVYPTFTFRSPSLSVVRVLGSWTEGSTAPYTVEDNYHDFGGSVTPMARSNPPPVREGGFLLQQNRPNPFNPATTISFALAREPHAMQQALLDVYDLRGRHVVTLVDGELAPGAHEMIWDGRDRAQRPVPSGVYIYSLKAGARTITRKMTLVR